VINIFSISSADQSIAYLSWIFGKVGTVLPGEFRVLGTMFKTFNTMVLTLGTVVLIYTTVVGLLATAHEGEFMGKKWSGLWVPLRSLMGIAALFPTGTGYSAIQIVFMWIIVQGVGAADTVWGTVLNYTSATGSPLNSASIPTGDINYQMQTLFQTMTCHASAKASYSLKRTEDNYFYFCAGDSPPQFCKDPLPQIDTTNPQSTTTQLNFGPSTGNSCGTLNFCNLSQSCPAATAGVTPDLTARIKCEACKAQQKVLNQIIVLMNDIAVPLVDIDYQYLTFYISSISPQPTKYQWIKNYCSSLKLSPDQCCVNNLGGIPLLGKLITQCKPSTDFATAYGGKNPATAYTDTSEGAMKSAYWPFSFKDTVKGTDFIDVMVQYYRSALGAAVTKAISEYQDPALARVWLEDAKKQGWIFAGGYYYHLAKGINERYDAAIPPFSANGMNFSASIANYRNNFYGASYLFQSSSAAAAASSSASSGPAEMQAINAAIKSTGADLLTNFMGSLTTGKAGSFNPDDGGARNPLLQMSNFGHSLLVTAEFLYVVSLALVLGTAIVGNLPNFLALGTGYGVNPVGAGITAAFYVLIPLVFAFIGVLITFGGMLAVYAPLIPYTIFTMAAIGWVIATVETMVAAPLVAFGMLSPGGQHEIFGRAEPALMLLLGVFLRPTLMIFGLIAAMLFAYVSVLLVNATFLGIMVQIAGRTPSVLETVFFVAAYTYLVITVLSKCFSLVHLIPERVMTWIGGQAVSYGEGEALGEVKRGVEGAASHAASGAAQTGKAPGEARRAYDKAKAGAEKGNKPDEVELSNRNEDHF
jgi:conjugal transfer/type IV secretion protein DotA/TraY